ncbi:Thiol-disulfide isomerase or thioredoxin [Pedobacter steynii]|uniref:Thiol-disulfide isomerase or thioredoxin n=1 Tax=Pedobacter steynii TaxID=430522 RepID=A0A1H0HKY4_9SPHI|nr:TlpA disulfide reductase family protein [Pedobacter steynii]NQX42583.1 AhpC/TSA family protein [Pedobacter steynii]SDO19724.1 Thiol-disulfide isomerase or thioredoxin [Pedobacter steynii]
MKKILLALSLVPAIGMCQLKNKTFTIEGKVADTKRAVNNTIYLKYQQNGQQFTDSAVLNNGNYHFKGSLQYPVKAVIQLKVADSVEKYYRSTRLLKDYAHEFYLDEGTLLANSSEKLQQTIIKGALAETDHQQLMAKLAPFYTRSAALYESEGRKIYESKDVQAIAKYTKKSYAIQDQIDSVERDFMVTHLESGIAFDMLQEYTRSTLEPSEIEPMFQKLQSSLKASAEGIAYAARIEKAKKTAIGALAPDFILKDRNGKDQSLSSLKGKLVLLDFWGSWCMPCRQTHPHLKELYSGYKSKGLEILGVSNESGNPETDYKKWTTALDEDKMDWINVLNTNNRSDKNKGILSDYAVNAFPTKVLIDRNGIIIKRFVGNTSKNAELLDEIVKQQLKSTK